MAARNSRTAMASGKNCPSCNTDWEEEETITQYFESQGYSHRKAVQTAAMYGCTPKSPKHFGKDVTGIEIRGKYDGISYWECQVCKVIFDRFTMEVADPFGGVKK